MELPSKFDLVRTASKGISEKSVYNKDVQLSKHTLDKIDEISEGDFLQVTNECGGMELSTYGKVEARSADTHGQKIGDDEVALGVTGRDAICAEAGEDSVKVNHVKFQKLSTKRKFLNRMLGVRPAVCRVRRAISTDAGYRICRLREDVKQTIGIEWGDQIVIQSSEGRIRQMKALPLTEKQKEIIEERRSTEYYQPLINKTSLRDGLKPENLPRIHIPQSAREALGIDNKKESGVHQPVKIHRDTQYVGFRILYDLTTPFLFVLIATFIGLDVGLIGTAILLCASLVIILSFTYLESRQVLR